MRLIIVCILVSIAGAVYSQLHCSAIRHYSDENEFWDFEGYNGVEVRGVKEIFTAGNNSPWSFIVRFCASVNVLDTNITRAPVENWSGWNHGIRESFTYVGMELHNPNQASAQASLVRKSFEQDFVLGDRGYPCIAGRQSTLYVYCGDEGATCANVPGLTRTHCMDGSAAQSGKLCMCEAEYDPADACTANITLLLLDCPSAYISPATQTPSGAPTPLSGGAVFGIIVLVLFLVTLVLCAGGFAYNYKVNDMRGVDAVPFISVFRGSRDRPYQPAPSQSGYGTVGEDS